MPRIARLITLFSRTDIQKLLQSARMVHRQPGLDIRVAPRTLDYARILIITPRKMGTAPQRNKIRRQFKSLFFTQKFFDGPCDVVIYCKKECINLSFTALQDLLMTHAGQCT